MVLHSSTLFSGGGLPNWLWPGQASKTRCAAAMLLAGQSAKGAQPTHPGRSAVDCTVSIVVRSFA